MMDEQPKIVDDPIRGRARFELREMSLTFAKREGREVPTINDLYSAAIHLITMRDLAFVQELRASTSSETAIEESYAELCEALKQLDGDNIQLMEANFRAEQLYTYAKRASASSETAARDAALEEAARCAIDTPTEMNEPGKRLHAEAIAQAIRALKSTAKGSAAR